MAVNIYTGDPHLCRVVHLVECPACGSAYEFMDAISVPSVTLGDEVWVCPKHGKAFSAEEEAWIQDSLQRALSHGRGHVMRGRRMAKKSVLLAKMGKGLDEVLKL